MRRHSERCGRSESMTTRTSSSPASSAIEHAPLAVAALYRHALGLDVT